MKRAAAICLLIVVITVAGCAKQEKLDYTYKGESDDWSAEYKTATTGSWTKRNGSEHFNGNTDNTLTITYKKDITELVSKHIAVSYKTAAGGGSQSLEYLEPSPSGAFTLLRESGKNIALETEYSVIKVTITVDDSTQALELKYDK
ncbi:hypothetical protein SAMN02745823_00345 [Sporobacter termitidis DSM 10068]|uniref:Lipocalin-like domain-containing protein n=1 Tax=Sporobacter termitidis DSM 10068 TaxID=1123282 RepID=A0A1M5U3K7_9FIRM|nr:hypothetical protein [Sporobacter termitidis]SHH57602.1 hypothetical protein SAMN02745823_00345 [Sporobacter termitidis DSM 10068]